MITNNTEALRKDEKRSAKFGAHSAAAGVCPKISRCLIPCKQRVRLCNGFTLAVDGDGRPLKIEDKLMTYARSCKRQYFYAAYIDGSYYKLMETFCRA